MIKLTFLVCSLLSSINLVLPTSDESGIYGEQDMAENDYFNWWDWNWITIPPAPVPPPSPVPLPSPVPPPVPAPSPVPVPPPAPVPPPVPGTDKCTCGVSKMKTEAGGITRISGGSKASPHEFPWMVRITGGCTGVCGGVLVSPRVVLSAFHCATPYNGNPNYPCDHSDGRRVALLGMHYNGDQEARIPIVKAYYPKNQNHKYGDYSSHDFVLYRLAEPARYTDKVGPICLPEPNSEYGGEKATAAGWGRTYGPSTSHQSPFLKKVELRVNPKRYKHKYFFWNKS